MKALGKIGVDAEGFIRHPNQAGYIPATEYNTPGRKGDARQIPGLPVGFTFHRDNISVEFQIPPASSVQELCQYLEMARAGVDSFYDTTLSTDVQWQAAVQFPEREMVEIPEALELGCEADYDAWSEGARMVGPKAGDMGMVRTGSCHLHFDFKGDPNRFTRLLDYYAGIPLTYDAGILRRETLRRRWYGQAGRYRYNEERGILEYRVPSSTWVRSPKQLSSFAWYAYTMAMKSYHRGRDVYDLLPEEVTGSHLANYINQGDMGVMFYADSVLELLRESRAFGDKDA